MSGEWFLPTAGAVPGSARLICFPPAGATASFFHQWRAPLLPDIEVCPIALPGRQSRSAEPAYTSMDSLVAALAAGIAPRLDRPYVFFGHSLGAAVAYETARALTAAGLPGPRAVIVSARRAPHAQRRPHPISALDDDEFVAALSRLGGLPPGLAGRRDLYRFFLGALRADFAVHESYSARHRLPGIGCPVLALAGTGDPLASPADMAGWRAVTSGAFRQCAFPGGHFFLRPASAEFLAVIRDFVLTS